MQFSLFGAAAIAPSRDDLAGVLLAGGDWVRTGEQARLSVVVSEEWRAAALTAAFTELGLGAEAVAAENGIAARTDFMGELSAQAKRWTRGAVLHPPTELVLTAGGLRLWAIAAGRADGGAYLFGTGESDTEDDRIHRSAGAQLARLGLAATAITARSHPGWRVTSQKRLRRLAELLGDAPPGCTFDWPT
jgi:hypothetical protein